jgi:protocatechuate 3,4-dioxygenase beta subunit
MTLSARLRRRTVALLAAVPAVLAFGARDARAQAQATLDPTPRDAEGPFYPRRLPSDADTDLTRVAGRSGRAQGTPLSIAGKVLDPSGRPLAGAKVELWQCDARGLYHHVGGDAAAEDPHFQGYGTTVTDVDGRYAFTTIRPVPYGGRPPHLHFKLAHPSARPLTTQLYPRGESAERFAGFGLSARDARARLEFTMAPGREASTLAAAYDFVLASAG